MTLFTSSVTLFASTLTLGESTETLGASRERLKHLTERLGASSLTLFASSLRLGTSRLKVGGSIADSWSLIFEVQLLMREAGGEIMSGLTSAATRSHCDFQVRDAEDRAFGFVGQARDFPAMREDDLRDDGEAEAGAFLVRGEIGFENFLPVFGRHAVAVVADFQQCFGGTGAAHSNFYLSAFAHGLDGVEEQIEQHLAQELFVGFDGERVAAGFHAKFLFLDVKVQGADDFAGGGGERDFRAADFARARVVDELGELRGDFVGLVHDGFGLGADFGRGVGQARNHLGHAANEVERIARLVREAGGGEVQFLEVRIQFARAHEADLEFGGLAGVAPGEAGTERGDAGEKADDAAQPEVARADGAVIFRGHGEDESVQFALGDERLKFGLGHPAHPRWTMIAAARTFAVLIGRRWRWHFNFPAGVGERWRKIRRRKFKAIRLTRSRFAAGKFATARGVVGQIARRDDDGGVVGRAFGADARTFDG